MVNEEELFGLITVNITAADTTAEISRKPTMINAVTFVRVLHNGFFELLVDFVESFVDFNDR